MTIIYLMIWIVLIGYTFLVAPGVGVIELDLIKDILLFNEVNPLIMSLFYLFGVWPFVFGGLLFNRKSESVPAWPFVLGMFFFGVFSLLPYYILNDSNHGMNRTPRWIKSITESKLVYLILTILSTWLLLYGILYGDVTGLISVFNYSWFVHIMTIDFILIYLLSILALYRVDRSNYQLGFIPVIDPLIYLLKDTQDHEKRF